MGLMRFVPSEGSDSPERPRPPETPAAPKLHEPSSVVNRRPPVVPVPDDLSPEDEPSREAEQLPRQVAPGAEGGRRTHIEQAVEGRGSTNIGKVAQALSNNAATLTDATELLSGVNSQIERFRAEFAAVTSGTKSPLPEKSQAAAAAALEDLARAERNLRAAHETVSRYIALVNGGTAAAQKSAASIRGRDVDVPIGTPSPPEPHRPLTNTPPHSARHTDPPQHLDRDVPTRNVDRPTGTPSPPEPHRPVTNTPPHSARHTDPPPGPDRDLYGWSEGHLPTLLPQVRRIVAGVKVLEDRSLVDRHADASFDIVEALQVSARVRIAVPESVTRLRRPSLEEVEQSETWLASVGYILDRSLSELRLPWPPPDREPPSIVTDLLTMYREAANARVDREGGADLLRRSLETIEAKAAQLLDGWNRDLAEAVASEASGGPSSRRSMFERLTTNLALLITLLQAPGAINDFPKDSVDLGRHTARATEVAYIATADAAGDLIDWLNTLRR